MKRALAALVFRRSGLNSLARALSPWSGVLGLNYHRIGDSRGTLFDSGVWSATAEAFDAQVRYLKRHTDVITPNDLADIVECRRRGRFALITFDDGYRDNYELAFPILKSHGVSATFFVTTGFVDHPQLPWWDRIAWMIRVSTRQELDLKPWIGDTLRLDGEDRQAVIVKVLARYKELPEEATLQFSDAIAAASGSDRPPEANGLWMSWDMIRQMHASGMVIGGHTVNHPVLARLAPERQLEEIRQSCKRIHKELGTPTHYFSYPVGGIDTFNQHTREGLGRAGVKFAFSYYGGMRTVADWDDYDVRRFAVEEDVDRDQFASVTAFPRIFARPRQSPQW